MSQNPAGLLANVAKHNFERRSQIAGRRNLHRDCLEQAELLFTLRVVLFHGSRMFHLWLLTTLCGRFTYLRCCGFHRITPGGHRLNLTLHHQAESICGRSFLKSIFAL
jgi:hypothetical protein